MAHKAICIRDCWARDERCIYHVGLRTVQDERQAYANLKSDAIRHRFKLKKFRHAGFHLCDYHPDEVSPDLGCHPNSENNPELRAKN